MRAIFKAMLGLFVEDAVLAIGLLVWLALAGYLLPSLSLGIWSGPMLFLGAAFVLVFSLRRIGR